MDVSAEPKEQGNISFIQFLLNLNKVPSCVSVDLGNCFSIENNMEAPNKKSSNEMKNTWNKKTNINVVDLNSG